MSRMTRKAWPPASMRAKARLASADISALSICDLCKADAASRSQLVMLRYIQRLRAGNGGFVDCEIAMKSSPHAKSNYRLI
jgi:hypothetical protein